MNWLIFALLTAVFSAIATLLQKKILTKEHAMEMSAVLALINLILVIPIFFFIDYSQLQLLPIILIFFVTILGSIAYFLFCRCVRHMEISEVSPLTVVGPGVTAILAFLILGEALTLQQILGIIILIIGTYILELKDNHDLLSPFKQIKKSKFIHLLFITLIIYGLTSVFDRFILTTYNITPFVYLAFVHLFVSIHFFIMITIFHKGIKDIKNGLKNFGPLILILSIFTLTYRIFQMYAVSLVFVGIVLAIKKASTLFVVALSGKLFHENNLLLKIFASIVLIFGVILIII